MAEAVKLDELVALPSCLIFCWSSCVGDATPDTDAAIPARMLPMRGTAAII